MPPKAIPLEEFKATSKGSTGKSLTVQVKTTIFVNFPTIHSDVSSALGLQDLVSCGKLWLARAGPCRLVIFPSLSGMVPSTNGTGPSTLCGMLAFLIGHLKIWTTMSLPLAKHEHDSRASQISSLEYSIGHPDLSSSLVSPGGVPVAELDHIRCDLSFVAPSPRKMEKRNAPCREKPEISPGVHESTERPPGCSPAGAIAGPSVPSRRSSSRIRKRRKTSEVHNLHMSSDQTTSFLSNNHGGGLASEPSGARVLCTKGKGGNSGKQTQLGADTSSGADFALGARSIDDEDPNPGVSQYSWVTYHNDLEDIMAAAFQHLLTGTRPQDARISKHICGKGLADLAPGIFNVNYLKAVKERAALLYIPSQAISYFTDAESPILRRKIGPLAQLNPVTTTSDEVAVDVNTAQHQAGLVRLWRVIQTHVKAPSSRPTGKRKARIPSEDEDMADDMFEVGASHGVRNGEWMEGQEMALGGGFDDLKS